MLITVACIMLTRVLCVIAVTCMLIMRALSSMFLYSVHVDRCCLHDAHQGCVCVQVGGVRTDSQSLPAGQRGRARNAGHRWF